MKIFGDDACAKAAGMIAISFMLGLGTSRVTSGLMRAGLAFTRTGWFYPFSGTSWDGWGVALSVIDNGRPMTLFWLLPMNFSQL